MTKIQNPLEKMIIQNKKYSEVLKLGLSDIKAFIIIDTHFRPLLAKFQRNDIDEHSELLN